MVEWIPVSFAPTTTPRSVTRETVTWVPLKLLAATPFTNREVYSFRPEPWYAYSTTYLPFGEVGPPLLQQAF